jgi:hypothetical protein
VIRATVIAATDNAQSRRSDASLDKVYYRPWIMSGEIERLPLATHKYPSGKLGIMAEGTQPSGAKVAHEANVSNRLGGTRAGGVAVWSAANMGTGTRRDGRDVRRAWPNLGPNSTAVVRLGLCEPSCDDVRVGLMRSGAIRSVETSPMVGRESAITLGE